MWVVVNSLHVWRANWSSGRLGRASTDNGLTGCCDKDVVPPAALCFGELAGKVVAAGHAGQVEHTGRERGRQVEHACL